MTLNYKLIATQLGESIKYESTINEINRTFLSLTNLTLLQYPNSAITSSRSQTAYDWIMTISNSSLSENKKASVVKDAIELLVLNEGPKLKLLSLMPRKTSANNRVLTKTRSWNYVNKARMQEIKKIKPTLFDFSKLIKFCEELNIAFSNKSYLSVTMLTRAILDHVPPIFGLKDFSEVANNYGSKSFKDCMLNLNNSSKKIADSYLHTQIRKSESLPNSTQVDFSNGLDMLLGEIIRIS